MLGALAHYVTHAEIDHFQPMKSNFGILPELDIPPRDKRQRYAAYVERGLDTMRQDIAALHDTRLNEVTAERTT
jgi:methylenetetrahydrofolate--tRNA-(uracil-5-)-methyltransferase